MPLISTNNLLPTLKTFDTVLSSRVYNGPKSEPCKEAASRNKSPPPIQPDEDSNKGSDEKAAPASFKGGKAPPLDHEKQLRSEFRSPRDFLLNLASEFVHFAAARIKELYKLVNDPTLKVRDYFFFEA